MKISDLNNYSVLPQQATTGQAGSTPQLKQQGVDVLGKTQNVLDTVFGGGKIGEAIGTKIAEHTVSPEAKQFVEPGPSGSQIAGDVARTALTFAPVGRLGTLAAKGLGSLGIGKAATVAGNVLAGGATGAAFDVADSVTNNRDISLGAGTFIGAGIPAASPVAKALARATSKVLGRGVSEITGALTGTSAETVQQAFESAKTGGKELTQFTDALRGATTPEKLVEATRTNIQKIASQRQKLFSETLSELGNEVVETGSAKTNFTNSLSDVGITVKNGVLDFSKSKLKLVPTAQSKLNTAFQEINSLPDSVTLGELDTTRQAVKAVSKIAGDDPSANLANKLVDDGTRAIRHAGEDVQGYGQMLDEFGETSEFLGEIERGLSTGNKKTVDQAYRRMATALKTNNEQRMALVRELDSATDGAILSQISGQQLSEAMPRGIFRQISAGIAGGAAVTGGLNPALLPGLLFASPRVVGEFARSLGIGARKSQLIIGAINDARSVLLKSGIISGVELKSDNKQ